MLPSPHGGMRYSVYLLLVSVLCASVHTAGSTAGNRVVCYYTNWSVYRPATAKFNPQNINPYLCTHLIYAFGGFTKDNTLKPFDKYQDIEQGGYAKFTGLKTYNKNLKCILAIGGWNEASSRFSPLVASSERRQQFVRNTIKFLRQNHFDGLDLDWEYPAFRDGGKPRDRENYAQFVQELREEFDRESSKTGRPRLLLTMAVPAGTEYIEKGYDIPKLNKYLDWFNLLTYDYHSAFEPAVNHHSPLMSLQEDDEYNFDAELNIDYTIKFYLNQGADREKLVVGIPTYGRSYTLFNPDATDIGSPSDGPGAQGDATREKGYLSYYEICQMIKEDPDWTVVQPNDKAMGPYAFKGNQWVGYDDEAIARRKAEYVASNGLGGIMFWSIDNDDFRGICTGKPYPIIEAAKDSLYNSLGSTDNDVITRSRKKNTSRPRTRPSHKNRFEEDDRNAISRTTNRRKPGHRKRTSTTTTTTTTTTPEPVEDYVSLRTSTTPAPPTTPDPGSDFKCEDEGFFPHPRDCKKYFWCLDSGPSNLGIVAHQFTCPSGLFFNKAADSCDYSRNVICSKSKASSSTSTSTTTTTHAPSTTTRRAPITAATSKYSYLRTTSTTTTPAPPVYEDEYEYDDEELDAEREDTDLEDAEDPKVIKELIDLIKKAGGLEELEKQLHTQGNENPQETVTTTAASISKSLYDKILSRASSSNLESFKNRFSETSSDNRVRSASQKYTPIVRNSRPGPQNAGVDKLPEFEGFLREKPQYVTISRPRATQSTEEEFGGYEDDLPEPPRTEATFVRHTIPQQNYVNIRRNRPKSPVEDVEEAEFPEDENYSERTSATSERSVPNTQYVSIRRTSTAAAPETEEVGTEAPLLNAINRYKILSRTTETTTFSALAPDVNQLAEKEDEAETTVPPTTTSTSTTTSVPSTSYFSTPRQFNIAETATTSTQLPIDIFTTTTQDYSWTERAPETIFIIRKTTETPVAPPSTFTPTTNPVDLLTTGFVVEGSTFGSSVLDTDTTLAPESIQAVEEDLTPRKRVDINEVRRVDEEQMSTTAPRNFLGISHRRIRPLKRVSTEAPSVAVNEVSQAPGGQERKGGTHIFRPAFRRKTTTTTTSRPTTLHHVFAIDYDDTTTSAGTPTPPPKREESAEEISQRLEKLVEVNRIVEIYSKQDNVRIEGKSSEPKTLQSTDLRVEKIPTLDKLGEVSRLTLIKLVDPQNVTQENVTREAKSRHILSPEYIFSVETSTIPLEGLFRQESERHAKNIVLTAEEDGKKLNIVYAQSVGGASTTQATDTTTDNEIEVTTSLPTTAKPNRPQLLRPNFRRPTYNPRTRSTASTPRTTTTERPTVSASSTTARTYLLRRGSRPSTQHVSSTTATPPTSPKTRIAIRRKFGGSRGETPQPKSTASPTKSNELGITEPTTVYKRRYTFTTKPSLRTTTPATTTTTAASSTAPPTTVDGVDQEIEQSINQEFSSSRYNQIGDPIDEEFVLAIKTISKAPPPVPISTPKVASFREVTPLQRFELSTTRKVIPPTPKPTPKRPAARAHVSRRPKVPEAFDKILPRRSQRLQSSSRSDSDFVSRTYRPVIDYDYYDDEDDRIIGKSNSQVKVILHGHGIIECLDQGNFPHPLSCRKFISCAKMENGGVVGWEYTCPKGLSYDPVGGICNWAAGLGCKE